MKATLVLSGGGSKGSFQCGAERVLREEQGYEWERIFGVSIGAFNATFLGQGHYQLLTELWGAMRESLVHRKNSPAWVAFKLLAGGAGFYDNRPSRELLRVYADGRHFICPVHVGRVSLTTGAYEQVSNDSPEFFDAVWHSGTMPVIWSPIGPRAWVDGGMRNLTPLGDAMAYDPTEIVVIACSSPSMREVERPGSILSVAKRALVDIAVNEIMVGDVQEALRLNHIVKQASDAGLTLRNRDGKAYRYYPITVIEPEEPLGDSMDFSQDNIRRSMRAGALAARRGM